MAYYISHFDPKTHRIFSHSLRTLSGHEEEHEGYAQKVQPGDRLICYVTKVSRIAGLFEVLEGPFRDDSPLYVDEGKDPYPIRFRIRALAWFDDIEKAIPASDKDLEERFPILLENKWKWLRIQSLTKIPDAVAKVIEEEILRQDREKKTYPLEGRKRREFFRHGGKFGDERDLLYGKSGKRKKKR